mmetsp:Transcript_22648/g.72878  ORF Transcript_22648/g.72878 Transcript_22648/m.72878 type:complete len:462 (-) Transcript_22648:14-1399(-)
MLMMRRSHLLRLGHRLDDTHSHRLAHVAHREAAQRRVVRVRLHAHGLGRHHGRRARVAVLHGLAGALRHLTRALVLLVVQLRELARDVRRVAVQHRAVARRDLARVVHDDHLSLEGLHLLGRVVLHVTRHVAALQLLHRHVLHVEAHVVARHGLLQLLVVHLHRLHLSAQRRRREHHGHARLQDARLHAAHRYSADTADLVHVLQRQAQRLVRRALGRRHRVQSLQQGRPLVPAHVGRLLDHVVAHPARHRHERDLLGLVARLLQERAHLVLDLVVARLRVVDRLVVHLVHRHHHLLHAQRVRQQRVLTGLAVLADARLELARTGRHHQHSHVGLRRARDHVLDEVTVTRRVDDGEVVLGRLELPQGDVDRDATLALRLQLVQHPRVLEGRLAQLGSLLLELLDGTLVDTAALVDQVTSGGGLAGVHVADHDQVHVRLLLAHGFQSMLLAREGSEGSANRT